MSVDWNRVRELEAQHLQPRKQERKPIETIEDTLAKSCCTFKYGRNLPTNFVACVDCPLDTTSAID